MHLPCSYTSVSSRDAKRTDLWYNQIIILVVCPFTMQWWCWEARILPSSYTGYLGGSHNFSNHSQIKTSYSHIKSNTVSIWSLEWTAPSDNQISELALCWAFPVAFSRSLCQRGRAEAGFRSLHARGSPSFLARFGSLRWPQRERRREIEHSLVGELLWSSDVGACGWQLFTSDFFFSWCFHEFLRDSWLWNL